MAEGCNNGVVVGSAPLAKEVDEAVNQNLCTRFGTVGEEQVLTRLLALSVGAIVAANAGGLDGGGKHDRTGIVMLIQGVQEHRGKAKVTSHKFCGVFGTVHACQVEDKICLLTGRLKKFCWGAKIIAVQLPDGQIREPAVLSVPNGFQGLDQISAHKSGRTGDENVHFSSSSRI